MTYNVEVIHGLTKKDIKSLDEGDLFFACKAMKLSSKSTRCLIMLELQLVSVEYTIKSKRINYLHNLLNSDSQSLARNVFLRQCDNPIKGDFVNLVKQDLSDFRMDLSFEDIMTYSKLKFKLLVKNACEKAYFFKLLEEKRQLSKGKEIRYEQFQIQPYLSPGFNLATDGMCRILKCRIRDLDVKENFPNAYNDTKCPFPNCKSSESQDHLISCNSYPDNCNLIPSGLKYEDIFTRDVDKQYQVMQILMQCIATRNELFPAHLHNSGRPVDPRRKQRLVSRSTTRGTNRQALSLVIRGQRRKVKYHSKPIKK